MKWDYATLATGKTHFSNVKINRINNKIAFGTNLKVEKKCRLTIMASGREMNDHDKYIMSDYVIYIYML